MDKTIRRQRANKYFAARGINPNSRGELTRMLDINPAMSWSKSTDSVITYNCVIEVEAFLFYMHLTITFTDSAGKTHVFEGDSGGIGLGDMTSDGILYFGNQETLLKATTFGVAFAAEDGGVIQVTWGTSGNASAVGVGEGGGAFGGSGHWTTS